MSINFSNSFKENLLNGILSPIVNRVKNDCTLDIELRQNNEIEIYYRGAQLFRVSEKCFSKSDNSLIGNISLPDKKVTPENVEAWLDIIPNIKNCLDINTSRHPNGPKGAELETEQTIIRENNLLKGLSQNTDYVIVDIEHDSQDVRFDLLGVKSTQSNRDRLTAPKSFAIMELKYDINAIFSSKEGKATLKDHFSDMTKFIQSGKLTQLGEEIKTLYNFKYDLGLFDKGSMKRCADNHVWEKPEYIIILADYNANLLKKTSSTERILKNELINIKNSNPEVFENLDVRFATSCGMGYALYSDFLMNFEQFIKFLDSIN